MLFQKKKKSWILNHLCGWWVFFKGNLWIAVFQVWCHWSELTFTLSYSGGIRLTVTGTSLQAVQSPKIYIRVNNQEFVNVSIVSFRLDIYMILKLRTWIISYDIVVNIDNKLT